MTLQTLAIASPLAIVVIAVIIVFIGNTRLEQQKKTEEAQIAEMLKQQEQGEGAPDRNAGRMVVGEQPVGVVHLPKIQQRIETLQRGLDDLSRTILDETGAASKPST